MNVEVVSVEEPATALRTFVHEADTFVERLGHIVFAVNCELYARQTALSCLGDCGLNERFAYPFASFSSGNAHAQDSYVCSHLADERQYIAPTQDLVISDGYEVTVTA